MKTIPIKPVLDIKPSNKPMDLIIKPTEKCNFKCTFCSSTSITDDKAKLLDLDYIFNFLKKYPNTNTIIVNGGDPLVVPISYYWKLLDYIEENNLRTNLSLTSNLYPFYLKPDKWTPLFLHPKVNVITSFQLDDSRLKHDNTPYTLDEFRNVQKLFKERIGYYLDFISVLTEENAHQAVDVIKVAKEFDVECKLNIAHSSGVQSKPFLQAKAYQIYLNLIELGLDKWEFNSKRMKLALMNRDTTCPISRKCDEGIRCLQPSGDYYSCGAFGDDREYSIDFNREMTTEIKTTPLQDDYELFSMNDWCAGCDLFDLCNGCRKTIKEHKQHKLNEIHCIEMKKIGQKIKSL